MKRIGKRSMAVIAAGLMVLTAPNVLPQEALTSITAKAAENYVKGNDESGLTYYAYSDRAEIVGVWDKQEEFVIPSEITTVDGVTLPVTAIADRAFYDHDELKAITIPDSVKTIGEYAFQYCYHLESVTLSEGVETIGRGSFYNCSALLNITIPGSVQSVESQAFVKCSSLRSVEFAEGEGCSIGYEAFYDLDALESVTMAAGVTSIGEEAFRGCDTLTEVVFSPTLEIIYPNAFTSCNALEEIDLPDSLRYLLTAFPGTAHVNNQTGAVIYVDDWAVKAADGITRLTIQEGTRGIADSAFSGISSTLAYVTFPDSLEIINEKAFYGCYNLVSLTLPENLKYIDNQAFRSCSGIQVLTIPASVEEIGEQAFYGASSLKTLTIQSKDCQIYQAADTFPSGTVIVGYADSTAYAYADAFGREFTVLEGSGSDTPDTPDTPSTPDDPSGNTWNGINPDINMDGKIDAADAAMLLVYAAESGAGNVSSFAEFMDKYFGQAE